MTRLSLDMKDTEEGDVNEKPPPKESIEWINASKLDPTGLVFQYEGEIYRAVYKKAVSKVMHLFEAGVVKELIDKGLLIDTQLTEFAIPGFGLILHYKKFLFY